MQMEEVRDKHNMWLVRALRDTAVNLHLFHDTLATLNSLNTGSPGVPGISRTGEGVLVPVRKTSTCHGLHTQMHTYTHFQTHPPAYVCISVNDTNRVKHTLSHSIHIQCTAPSAATRLDHMLPHLSVSQRDQNKEATSAKMMNNSNLYRLTCPAF